MAAEPTDEASRRATGVLVLFDSRQSVTPRTSRQRRRETVTAAASHSSCHCDRNLGREPAAPELWHSIAGAAMPWKCPACQNQIADNGVAPEPKRVYRCHVCRLELTLDETTHKLTIVPLATGVIRRVTDSEP